MPQNKVISEVSSLIDFIKTQVTNDLAAAKNKEIINLDQEDLRKIAFVVESSISNSFINNIDISKIIKILNTSYIT